MGLCELTRRLGYFAIAPLQLRLARHFTRLDQIVHYAVERILTRFLILIHKHLHTLTIQSDDQHRRVITRAALLEVYIDLTQIEGAQEHVIVLVDYVEYLIGEYQIAAGQVVCGLRVNFVVFVHGVHCIDYGVYVGRVDWRGPGLNNSKNN